jgi:hypothetical protein
LDELAAEKLEAEAMRKIQYGDKEWQANALRGGMPWWKYISNRFLTFVETFSSAQSFRSTTPAIAPLRVICSNGYRWRRIRMTSFLTTKFWRK